VVAEFFVRAGWAVTLGAPIQPVDLPQAVAEDWYDVAGLSISCTSRVPVIKETIAGMRRRAKNPRMPILVGGCLFTADPSLVAEVSRWFGAQRRRSARLRAPAGIEQAGDERAREDLRRGWGRSAARRAVGRRPAARRLRRRPDRGPRRHHPRHLILRRRPSRRDPRGSASRGSIPSRPRRDKVREMLQDVATTGVSPRRQVNHVAPGGAEFPVAYTAVRLGAGPNLVAIGRDLRGIAVLQQRLVEAQQAMERDYWRMRHIETRYRLLFQLSTESVLVVDVATMKIVDANPAAGRLFGVPAKRLIGRTFPDPRAKRACRGRAVVTAPVGRSEAPVRLESQQADCASGCRWCGRTARRALVRLLALHAEPVSGGERKGGLRGAARHARRLHDHRSDGKVPFANRAFPDLAQLATEEQARGGWAAAGSAVRVPTCRCSLRHSVSTAWHGSSRRRCAASTAAWPKSRCRR
jgi:PAS domain-containing protein